MSNREATYFLAPVGNPPEGLIRLGNIISAPAFVDDPINEEYIPPSEASLEVTEHSHENFQFDISARHDGLAGIWASFLQTLGIGGDMTVHWSKECSEKWSCEKLTTITFNPKLAYISQCLSDEGVKYHLRVNKPWLGASKLFMITGIKVAYGATSTISHAAERGLNLNFGTDLLALGVPISFGPQVASSKGISVKQSQDNSEPFVFAFRIRRIKISRKGEVHHESYNKGQVLGIKVEGDEEDVEVVVDGVEDHDVDGQEFHLSSKDAFDQGVPAETRCKVVKVENDL
ncbi:hypothetical protein FPOAC2_04265 [Fusarium poae]|uniref:hypothetical protein n=1 Tax=Fusarium poae TaxID=36050 RepID=UPI001CE78354|nr:hypothetical protein FPOAC1_004160 [Fusarium poae]KAG8670925.1 hypothetical protein FPOAC1_004160 [Fusarium poae]